VPARSAALLATLRTLLVFRVSWGMWGTLQWGEGATVENGTELQNVNGERDLAVSTGYQVTGGMIMLVNLLRTVLTAFRGTTDPVLAAVAHDAACAAWAVLALDPLSAESFDAEMIHVTSKKAVQVLVMLHTDQLLDAAAPAWALQVRLMRYSDAQVPNEPRDAATLLLESQTASQLARLLMVATTYDMQPGALEAALPGVSLIVSRLVDHIGSVVFAYRRSLVATLVELNLTPEAEGTAAAETKVEAAVREWSATPQSVLPLLQELELACVLLLPLVQQSTDRSRAALALLPAIASLGAVVLDSSIDAVKTVRVTLVCATS
jgi:hypothetical protein